MKRIVLALACLTAAHAAQAEILDVNIGSDSFRAALSGQLSRMFDVDKGQYDFGLLSKRRDSDDLYQGHFGVLLTGDAGASDADVSAGLGVRFIGTDFGNATGGALALGGQLEFRLPAFNRLGLTAYGYGAPSATGLGDVDRYTELAVTIDYQVLRDASIYLGYRNLKYRIDDNNIERSVTADTGLHAGLRLNF